MMGAWFGGIFILLGKEQGKEEGVGAGWGWGGGEDAVHPGDLTP